MKDRKVDVELFVWSNDRIWRYLDIALALLMCTYRKLSRQIVKSFSKIQNGSVNSKQLIFGDFTYIVMEHGTISSLGKLTASLASLEVRRHHTYVYYFDSDFSCLSSRFQGQHLAFDIQCVLEKLQLCFW